MSRSNIWHTPRKHGKLIRYVIGDATKPQTTKPAVIPHICNDEGRWGSGFVLALNEAFGTAPRDYYQLWYKHSPWTFRLGAIQPVLVRGTDGHWPESEMVVVMNMIGQRGVKSPTNPRPIRYGPVAMALRDTAEWIFLNMPNAEVHMPRIGSGLAGGDWGIIESLVESAFYRVWYDGKMRDIPVTVYDLPESAGATND